MCCICTGCISIYDAYVHDASKPNEDAACYVAVICGDIDSDKREEGGGADEGAESGCVEAVEGNKES